LPIPENPKSVLYSPALCLHPRKLELDFTDESKSRERPLPPWSLALGSAWVEVRGGNRGGQRGQMALSVERAGVAKATWRPRQAASAVKQARHALAGRPGFFDNQGGHSLKG
jgi:hypothetical protein